MKKHFFGSAFSMKRTLRCMKNEARLRLVKRGFAVLMVRALRFTFAGGKRFIAELCNYIPLLCVKSLRRRVDFISLSAYA